MSEPTKEEIAAVKEWWSLEASDLEKAIISARLEKRVAQLTARVAELEEDGKMLEWWFRVSQNCGPYPVNITRCVEPDGSDESWLIDINGNTFRGDTPRAAIRAAMGDTRL